MARVDVASAGPAIGVPVLVPVALIGGALASVAYAAYKIGIGRRDREEA